MVEDIVGSQQLVAEILITILQILHANNSPDIESVIRGSRGKLYKIFDASEGEKRGVSENANED